MTPNPESGRRARENGITTEGIHRAVDALTRVGDNMSLLDGPDFDVKSAAACVRGGTTAAGSEYMRSGRFRFDPEQHAALLAINGTYKFYLIPPEGEPQFACERRATDLPIPLDKPSTLTVHGACPLVAEQLSCPVVVRGSNEQ